MEVQSLGLKIVILFKESHYIVGSPDPHEGTVSHIHAGSAHQIQHPNEAIIDDHHRMIYAAYQRY